MWILSNKKSDHINTLNHTIKVDTSPNGSKHLIEQGGRLKQILTLRGIFCKESAKEKIRTMDLNDFFEG